MCLRYMWGWFIWVNEYILRGGQGGRLMRWKYSSSSEKENFKLQIVECWESKTSALLCRGRKAPISFARRPFSLSEHLSRDHGPRLPPVSYSLPPICPLHHSHHTVDWLNTCLKWFRETTEPLSSCDQPACNCPTSSHLACHLASLKYPLLHTQAQHSWDTLCSPSPLSASVLCCASLPVWHPVLWFTARCSHSCLTLLVCEVLSPVLLTAPVDPTPRTTAVTQRAFYHLLSSVQMRPLTQALRRPVDSYR